MCQNEDIEVNTIPPKSALSSGLIGLQSITEFKKELSRTLRRRETPAEKILWQAIRNRKCAGAKFRRQQVIDGYVADFYCEEARLVIEADGSIHQKEEVERNDKRKNAAYKARGLYILRFENKDIFTNLAWCLLKIKETVKSRKHYLSSPLFQERGGSVKEPG
jgi:very-short-patch-repair endonuclease